MFWKKRMNNVVLSATFTKNNYYLTKLLIFNKLNIKLNFN